MDEAIKEIFRRRDVAVANKSYERFASTQLKEIPNAAITGYLSSDYLKTDVINIVDETESKKVVFVKENYQTHAVYLLYFVVNTTDGWKIYDIVYPLQ